MFVDVGTSDLVSSPWFMDTVGRDYWVYREMHASGGWLEFGTGHGVHI